MLITLSNNIAYEIKEMFCVNRVKDSNGSTCFIGRYFVPFSIVDNIKLMQELTDRLNPSKCEGSEYLLNMDRKHTQNYPNFIDVIFFYSFG